MIITSIIYLSNVSPQNMEEIRKNKVIRNNKEVSCCDANVQICIFESRASRMWDIDTRHKHHVLRGLTQIFYSQK